MPPVLSNLSSQGVSAGPEFRSAAFAGDGRLDGLAAPRLASNRLADPAERSVSRLLMTKISLAELTVARSLRALAIAQRQPSHSTPPHDPFRRLAHVGTTRWGASRSEETNHAQSVGRVLVGIVLARGPLGGD